MNSKTNNISGIVTPEQYISAISANIAAFHELMRISEVLISRAEDEDLKALYEISDKIADHSEYADEMAGEVNDLTEAQEKVIAAAKARQAILDRAEELWANYLKAHAEDERLNALIRERNAEKDAKRADLQKKQSALAAELAAAASDRNNMTSIIARIMPKSAKIDKELAAIEPNEDEVDTASAIYEELQSFCKENGLAMPDAVKEEPVKAEPEIRFSTNGKKIIAVHIPIAKFGKSNRFTLDGVDIIVSPAVKGEAIGLGYKADEPATFAVAYGDKDGDENNLVCTIALDERYKPVKFFTNIADVRRVMQENATNLERAKERDLARAKAEQQRILKEREVAAKAAEHKRAEEEKIASERIIDVHDGKAIIASEGIEVELAPVFTLNGKRCTTDLRVSVADKTVTWLKGMTGCFRAYLRNDGKAEPYCKEEAMPMPAAEGSASK